MIVDLVSCENALRLSDSLPKARLVASSMDFSLPQWTRWEESAHRVVLSAVKTGGLAAETRQFQRDSRLIS
jgi:hypothetical protein